MIKEVLRVLSEFLSQIEYFYTFLDSTKFSKEKELKLFACIRVGE